MKKCNYGASNYGEEYDYLSILPQYSLQLTLLVLASFCNKIVKTIWIYSTFEKWKLLFLVSLEMWNSPHLKEHITWIVTKYKTFKLTAKLKKLECSALKWTKLIAKKLMLIIKINWKTETLYLANNYFSG